jgi:hypothetical protein
MQLQIQADLMTEGAVLLHVTCRYIVFLYRAVFAILVKEDRVIKYDSSLDHNEEMES